MGLFTCTQEVTVSDIGQDYLITNKGYIRILQETANLASSSVGHGINDIEKTGTTWVLLYWRLKIYKRVNYNEKLLIKTWANFEKNIYSIRNFEIYHKNELVAKADSKWVFVDAKNHIIKKLSDDIINLYGTSDKKVFTNELKEKIKLPDNIKESFIYTTMKRDLDANHHVNNISFLDIAIEALPENLKDTCFSNVSIIYKKEILYKNIITCYYENKDNQHIIYLYNNSSNTLSGAVILSK